MAYTEFADDSAALDYIKMRGYASYSSIKNVRDCVVPVPFTSPALNFGKELHSRFLEGVKLKTLTATEEQLLDVMIKKLKANPLARALTDGAEKELEFKEELYGVPVLGYIDSILRSSIISDLKSTRLTKMEQFVNSMDFLQAAIYIKAKKAKDFYYIGISKEKPNPVMVFSVKQYPVKLRQANVEMERTLKRIQIKLWKKQ